jgi:hypothetical protein
MNDNNREPWELLSITLATYLSLYGMHCVFVALEIAQTIAKYENIEGLQECFEIYLLLL